MKSNYLKCLSALVLLVLFPLVSKSQIQTDWVQNSFSKKSGMFYHMGPAGSESFSTLNKVMKGYSMPMDYMSIKVYDYTLQSNSEIIFNPSIPELSDIGIIADKYIYTKQLNMPTMGKSPVASDNKIRIYGFDGNMIEELVLDAEYKYFIIEGNIAQSIIYNNYSGIKNVSTIDETKDHKNLIIWGRKDDNSSKSPDKNNIIKIYVYNENIEKTWEETFVFEDIFGKDAVINSLRFDVSNDNKLFVFCQNSGKVKMARLRFAYFDSPGTKPKIYEYPLKYDFTKYAYRFGDNGHVYFSGTTGLGEYVPTITKNNSRLLFFIDQDYRTETAAIPVTYELNKEFYAQYPAYSKGGMLAKNLVFPFEIFLMDDGILYVAENNDLVIRRRSNSSAYHTSYNNQYNHNQQTSASPGFKAPGTSSSKTKSNIVAQSFTFIKFSFDGKIEWIKMINKKVTANTTYKSILDIKFFQQQNDLVLFYSDNPANVNNPKGKLVSTKLMSQIGLVASRITKDGQITSQVLNYPGKSKVLATPYETINVSDNTYIVSGFKTKPFSLPDYFFAKIQLK